LLAVESSLVLADDEETFLVAAVVAASCEVGPFGESTAAVEDAATDEGFDLDVAEGVDVVLVVVVLDGAILAAALVELLVAAAAGVTAVVGDGLAGAVVAVVEAWVAAAAAVVAATLD
jgi:hypothetical protein